MIEHNDFDSVTCKEALYPTETITYMDKGRIEAGQLHVESVDTNNSLAEA